MIIAIIGINLTIALLCLWMAWRVWQFHQPLRHYADQLEHLEAQVNEGLKRSPLLLAMSQKRTLQVRQSYLELQVKVSQIQDILRIVVICLRLLKRLL